MNFYSFHIFQQIYHFKIVFTVEKISSVSIFRGEVSLNFTVILSNMMTKIDKI